LKRLCGVRGWDYNESVALKTVLGYRMDFLGPWLAIPLGGLSPPISLFDNPKDLKVGASGNASEGRKRRQLESALRHAQDRACYGLLACGEVHGDRLKGGFYLVNCRAKDGLAGLQ
jgi:hypothetical protein